MKDIDVNMTKVLTLVSDIGALEFAKRFRVRNGTVDLSPLSVSTIRAMYHSVAVCPVLLRVKEITGREPRLSTTFRLRGGGYRVCSATSCPKARRWRRHYLVMHAPRSVWPLPILLWLGFPEGILNCYQK